MPGANASAVTVVDVFGSHVLYDLFKRVDFFSEFVKFLLIVKCLLRVDLVCFP